MSRIRRLSAAAALAAAVSVSLGGTAVAQSNDPYDCSDFSTQQEAQQQYDSTSGDPSGLDRDGDGRACESLPSGSTTTSEPESTTTQPAPTSTTSPTTDGDQPPANGQPADKDCSDLTHEEAVALLAEDPSDPHRLDRDGDGKPCESLAGAEDDDAGADDAEEDGTAPTPEPQEGHIAVTG